jgi:hypothetical protein
MILTADTLKTDAETKEWYMATGMPSCNNGGHAAKTKM